MMKSHGYLNGRLFDQGRIDQSGVGNLRLGGKWQVHRGALLGRFLLLQQMTSDDVGY